MIEEAGILEVESIFRRWCKRLVAVLWGDGLYGIARKIRLSIFSH